MADGVLQAVLEAARKQRQDSGEGRLMSDLIWLGGGGAWDWDSEVACCQPQRECCTLYFIFLTHTRTCILKQRHSINTVAEACR
jgi:hypothetical protein